MVLVLCGRWCLQLHVALYTVPNWIYGKGSPKRASRPATAFGYDVISSSGMRTASWLSSLIDFFVRHKSAW